MGMIPTTPTSPWGRRMAADRAEIRKTAREADLEERARRSMRYFVGNYRKIDWLRNVIDEMLKLMD